MKRIKILTAIVCVAVAAVMLWQVVPIAAQNPLSPFRASSGSGNPVSEQPAASFAASPNAMTPQPYAITPEIQKLLNPIASMIDANTFFVGHIDLARLDPELAAANLKTQLADVLTKLRSNKALAESLDDEGLVEALRMSMRGLDIGTMLVQSKLDELRSLGCNEIYLTANSKIMTVSAVQVVCLAPARNLAKLEQTLLLPEQAEFGWVFQHDGDKLIANLIAPFSTTSLDDANVGNRVAFQHRLIRPAVRPELAAGLDRIKNAPVKLVFAPDGVIRRFLQSWPMMASSMMFQYNPGMMMFFAGANTSTKFVDDSIRWMAIGLDPARPVLAMTIQSKTPEAAQDLHDMVVSAKVALSVSMADQHVNRRYNSYGYNNNLEQFSAALDFAMLFLPVVQGDRLQLVIDEKRLADTTELITNAYTNVVLPSRESSHKMQCANNMKQIMLALHNYHDANRVFPTAYRVNEDGKPLHSWRVALLPYIEQTALYDRMVPYMNEPWDSENNKQFHNVNVPQYQCPAAKNAPGMTNYSVVVGRADEEQARELGLLAPSSTAFPEPNKWVSLAHMSDGTSNTIAVVERKEPVCWMDPSNEITLEEAIKLYNLEQSKVGSAHKGGFNIGICDGSVQFWDLTNPRYYIDLWKAGLTANGGESGRLWLY